MVTALVVGCLNAGDGVSAEANVASVMVTPGALVEVWERTYGRLTPEQRTKFLETPATHQICRTVDEVQIVEAVRRYKKLEQISEYLAQSARRAEVAHRHVKPHPISPPASHERVKIACCYCGGTHARAAEVRACFDQTPEERRLSQIEQVGRRQAEPIDPTTKEVERRLRLADPTPPERTLWEGVLAYGVGNFPFEREAMIEGFVVDFYCRELGLAIEVDGRHHTRQRLQDDRRDEILRANHHQVLRFSAREVMRELGRVTKAIGLAVERRSRELAGTPVPRRPDLDEEFEREWSAYRYGPEPRSDEPSERAQERIARRNKDLIRSVTSQKHKFRCQLCCRDFVDHHDPWPMCRRCGQVNLVASVCRDCDASIPGQRIGRCHDCEARLQDLRASRKNAAADWYRTGRHSRGT